MSNRYGDEGRRRSLANVHKFEHIRRVNTLLGLPMPWLVTPLELIQSKRAVKVDPEIEKIRAVRQRISEECRHDPKRLLKYYQQVSRELRASGQFRFADEAAGGQQNISRQ